MSLIWELIVQNITTTNVLVTMVLLTVLWYIYDLVKTRNMPPGPWFGIPLLGNTTLLGVDRYIDQINLAKKYGPVFMLKLGVWKMVYVVGIEAVKEVLVKKSADFAGRAKLPSLDQPTLGSKGVVQADYGPAWHLHKKMFMSALREFMSDHGRLEMAIMREVRIMENYIKKQKENPFDPDDIITLSIGNIICSLTLDQRFDGSESDYQVLVGSISGSLRGEDMRQSIVDLFPILRYFPDKPFQNTMERAHDAIKVTSKFLKEHEETYHPGIVRDFIDGLIKAKHEAIEEKNEETAKLLSHDHMVITIADMFFAGFETTSTTLRWMFLYLANHPEIQKALQEELDRVVGPDRRPSLEDRADLHLLQATIMENQRLSNIAPELIPHMATKDTTLCGYEIPRGTPVIVNLYSVHMNPDVIKDPEKFNPYRFIGDDGKVDTTRGNYFPFGAGARVCAGESLAKVELFLFLSNILYSFTIKRKEDQLLNSKGILGFTLGPRPYEVIFVPRD